MYAVMANGRVEFAADHPVNPEVLLRYEEQEGKPAIPYEVIEIPERSMEDVMQHVARPRRMLNKLLAARGAAGAEPLEAVPSNLLNFLASAISILEYIVEMEFAPGRRTLNPELNRDLTNWMNVKLQLLTMGTGEEIQKMADELHLETIKWQTAVMQAVKDYDAAQYAKMAEQANLALNPIIVPVQSVPVVKEGEAADNSDEQLEGNDTPAPYAGEVPDAINTDSAPQHDHVGSDAV